MHLPYETRLQCTTRWDAVRLQWASAHVLPDLWMQCAGQHVLCSKKRKNKPVKLHIATCRVPPFKYVMQPLLPCISHLT